MNKKVKKIWEEIFKLDPNFKKYEKELKKSISKFIHLAPDTNFDENFKESLRSLLKARVEDLSEKKAHSSKKSLNFFFTIMQNLAVITAGFLIGTLPIFNAINPEDKTIQTKIDSSIDSTLDFSPKIIANKQEEAYGKINLSQNEQMQGRGSGGEISTTKDIKTQGTEESATSYGEIGIMPIYEGNNYIFTYDNELNLPKEDKLEVYKKINDQKSNLKFSNTILKNFDLGLADINSFDNLELINLQLSENKEFGYSIHLNLAEGQFLISQNYAKWPNPLEKCWQEYSHDFQKAEDCNAKNRLKLQDIPTDEELIKIAKDFLLKHKISLNSFEEPFVLDDWKHYLKMEKRFTNEEFAPEEIAVIFPIEIDNKAIFDSNNKSGLYVGVNIRHKKVSHVQNLSSQTYEKSLYEVIKDEEMINNMIKQGGINPIYTNLNEDAIEIKLDEPEFGLMRHWRYQDGKNEQLLVPAIFFSIKDAPEDFLYPQKKIIIPLVKDAIDLRPIIFQ